MGPGLTRPFRRVAVKCSGIYLRSLWSGRGILVITLALSIFVNTQVVERYYLRRQTGYVEAAGQRLEALIGRGWGRGSSGGAGGKRRRCW